MVSSETFAYLSRYYADAMDKAYREIFKGAKEKSLQGYGKFDRGYHDYREGVLWTLSNKVICEAKEKLILSDANERCLYAYSGRWWEKIDTSAFMKELVKRIFRTLEVGIRYMPFAEKISRELLSTIKSSDEYLFTPYRRYIAFRNGVFDLKDGKMKEPSSKYVTDLVLDFDYRSREECRLLTPKTCILWDGFICGENGVFTDRDISEDFQSFCGMFLIDRKYCKFEYLACIHGPGANGKSVLVDAVSEVFGENYYATFTMSQLFKEGTNSSFCISDLEGKLLNVIGDLEKRDFSGGSFKNFMSGQKVMAREPYGKKNRPVKPPMMICCTNEMPESRDDSEGHHRRMLPFQSTAKMWTEKDKDPNLTAKLTTDDARAYIFDWIYEGYVRVRNNGGKLPLSETSMKAQKSFKARANSMRRWWEASVWDIPPVGGNGFWKPLQELYSEYKAYCSDNCCDQMYDYELSRMIASNGAKKAKHGVGVVFYLCRKEIENEIKNEETDDR